MKSLNTAFSFAPPSILSLTISKERKERMLSDQIQELSFAIEEIKAEKGERWTIKQIESQKKRLEQQLKALSDETRKDDLINFEELGIDSIMVDDERVIIRTKLEKPSKIKGLALI